MVETGVQRVVFAPDLVTRYTVRTLPQDIVQAEIVRTECIAMVSFVKLRYLRILVL